MDDEIIGRQSSPHYFLTSRHSPNKLRKLKLQAMEPAHPEDVTPGVVVEGIPSLVLPTRWESLKNRIGNDNVSLRTIVRPIPQAMG